MLPAASVLGGGYITSYYLSSPRPVFNPEAQTRRELGPPLESL